MKPGKVGGFLYFKAKINQEMGEFLRWRLGWQQGLTRRDPHRRDHRAMESFGLEKSSKIIESNH